MAAKSRITAAAGFVICVKSCLLKQETHKAKGVQVLKYATKVQQRYMKSIFLGVWKRMIRDDVGLISTRTETQCWHESWAERHLHGRRLQKEAEVKWFGYKKIRRKHINRAEVKDYDSNKDGRYTKLTPAPLAEAPCGVQRQQEACSSSAATVGFKSQTVFASFVILSNNIIISD